MIKWTFGILYILVLVLAVLRWPIAQRQASTAHLTATRPLAANRFLLPGDVKTTDFGAGYLRRAIPDKEEIRADDLTAFPEFDLLRNNLSVAMPVARRLIEAGAINAGVKARLCRSGKVLLDPVNVQLVLCGNSGGDCIAIVDLPTDKIDAVANQFSNADVLLQPAPSSSAATNCG